MPIRMRALWRDQPSGPASGHPSGHPFGAHWEWPSRHETSMGTHHMYVPWTHTFDTPGGLRRISLCACCMALAVFQSDLVEHPVERWWTYRHVAQPVLTLRRGARVWFTPSVTISMVFVVWAEALKSRSRRAKVPNRRIRAASFVNRRLAFPGVAPSRSMGPRPFYGSGMARRVGESSHWNRSARGEGMKTSVKAWEENGRVNEQG